MPSQIKPMSYGQTITLERSKKLAPTRRRKQHYALNRRLLFVTLAILAVVLPASYFWYKHQRRQSASALLARAEQLEQKEDWAQATTYYQRYLQLEPEDTKALLQLVQVVAKGERTRERLNRFNTLLYRTIGRAPERSDLRRMLAENLLDLGRFEEAAKEAQWLLDNSSEEARSARKITALSLAARASLEQGVTFPQASTALLDAAEESPGDPRLIGVAAYTLREHAKEIANPNSADIADQLMDKLVAADPKNVLARLTRYQYRVRYQLPDDAGDLKAALEVEPDNVDAILLSARAAVGKPGGQASPADAKALFQRAIDVAPRDPRAHVYLAELLDQTGQQDESLALLQKARKATEDDFDVRLKLADVQINAKEIGAAERTLQELEADTPSHLVEFENEEAKTRVENQLRLLRARIELGRDNVPSAVSRLNAILLTMESKPGHTESQEWIETTQLLAQIHARSGQWDKASEYFGALSKARPRDIYFSRVAADAYLKSGNAQAAMDTIDEFIRLEEPTGDLHVQLVQAHLALQLSRPSAEQNWSEFKTALEPAKVAAPNRSELVFSEATYLVADAEDRQEGVKAATNLLKAFDNKFKDDVAFWRTAALIYQELGQHESMQRALARHREIASSESDHAVLEATLLIKEEKYKQADNLLSKLPQSVNSDERKNILRLQVEALLSDNDVAGALERVKRSIEIDPKNPFLLAMGVEVALTARNFQAAEAWEKTLGDLTNDGFDVRFLRVRRKLSTYDELQTHEKEDLGQRITELRTERPKWYPAIALAAQYAQLQGDRRRALSDYRLAIDLGDRRPGTLQQIVAMLYKNGRLDEAQTYLSYLPVTRSTGQFIDTMAIELAMRQDDSAAALKTARESVERFPDDPLRRIALANVLIRYAKQQEGLEVLRNAARDFKNDTGVWLALFSAYVQTGKLDEARNTLAALVKSSVLPQDQRYFVAAQGYELLGDTEGARKLYQLAIEQNPKDSAVRLKYAKLLGRSDPKTAQAQYGHVLQQEPANREARRELAILLAARGQETDWAQATQLLATTNGESVSDARTNDRLRAMLLSRKGRTRAERISNCQAAREILQRLIEIETAEAGDLNRQLVAQVLQQEANLSGNGSLLSSARNHLRAVANRAPTAQTLSLYIDFLLRHGAGEAINPGANSSAQDSNPLSAEQKEAFLAEADSRLDEFQQFRSAGGIDLEVISVAFESRLLQARGRQAEAKSHIDEFVAKLTEQNLDENTKAQRYLAIGKLYTSISAHADAEKWYRRLMELLPNGYVPVVQSLLAQEKRKEAIEFCLSVSDGKPTAEMATLLANVMTAPDKPLDNPQAQAAIDTAIKNHSQSIDLLHAEAVRRASLGQYDEAIAIFRRVLEIDPENVLALNNFATVLAERPNQRGEALEHIERAIDLAGRKAALLDTHGTILLKIGDAKQAIISLEEATAGGEADARYYLHLAAAYQLAQRYEDAQRMLGEARGFGLDKFVLTGDDRELLAKLDEKLSSLPTTGTP